MKSMIKTIKGEVILIMMIIITAMLMKADNRDESLKENERFGGAR